ncbi:hypothetical protein M758_3G232900 [Ceratodon purpureus]|uniref:Uncharacterized protein n=1 Tax=Ceratodon purpureus TaxID=3225 RepID=A0A8T0ILV4_CERPU|nr:hypothetical protein KC19_3G231900 [Ceratodon purpureus]KAG0624239.1 hypothetical protein M758_3G232900 [Ceratodon purpureus]
MSSMAFPASLAPGDNPIAMALAPLLPVRHTLASKKTIEAQPWRDATSSCILPRLLRRDLKTVQASNEISFELPHPAAASV